jgi:hypothetical protein
MSLGYYSRCDFWSLGFAYYNVNLGLDKTGRAGGRKVVNPLIVRTYGDKRIWYYF